MLFNSTSYGIFLIAVFFVYWSLAGSGRRSLRLWFLLAASYFFYANWRMEYLGLIVGVTVLNYAAGLGIDAAGRKGSARMRRLWVAAAAFGSLGLLSVFKYFNLFAESARDFLYLFGVSWTAPVSKLLLPVGISFYTFQSLSYAVDVYRGQVPAARSFRDFALYVAFFPQLVAGPIVRSKDLLPQFQKDPVSNRKEVMAGLFQVLYGLFKKMVIADTLAVQLVDHVFSKPGAWGSLYAWLAMYSYTMQIYCDFSGYSDVAIGSARMLGIKIPENFNRPYMARNLREFWRRWHISLSTWLRDYLYISLGGNREGKSRMYQAIFLTMLLGGLWHGASWTFVIWGAYHGVLLMINRWWQDRPKKKTAPDEKDWLVVWSKRAVTFHLVCLGWLIFRSQNIETAIVMLKTLFSGPVIIPHLKPTVVFALLTGYLLHVSPVGWRDKLAESYGGMPAIIQGIILAVFLGVFSMMSGVSNPFIYFQF